jgi:hypothetical protein
MKYCSECRHRFGGGMYLPETFCNVVRRMDGRARLAQAAREDESACGREARLFEPRETRQPGRRPEWYVLGEALIITAALLGVLWVIARGLT